MDFILWFCSQVALQRVALGIGPACSPCTRPWLWCFGGYLSQCMPMAQKGWQLFWNASLQDLGLHCHCCSNVQMYSTLICLPQGKQWQQWTIDTFAGKSGAPIVFSRGLQHDRGSFGLYCQDCACLWSYACHFWHLKATECYGAML